MSLSSVSTLRGFIEESNGIATELQYKNWHAKVEAFISVALGAESTSDFLDVNVDYWTERKASNIGFIYGLLSKIDESGDQVEYIQTIDENSEEEAKALGKIGSNNTVFIVHGHDNESKEQLARFLEKIGLTATILHEQANMGLTIIEKFEEHAKVGFAIVLLTPDDMVDSKYRARQNVIFELGYFIGKLGRSRVAALYKSNVELPSDFSGVIYIALDEAGAWKLKLAQELVHANMSIDLRGLI